MTLKNSLHKRKGQLIWKHFVWYSTIAQICFSAHSMSLLMIRCSSTIDSTNASTFNSITSYPTYNEPQVKHNELIANALNSKVAIAVVDFFKCNDSPRSRRAILNVRPRAGEEMSLDRDYLRCCTETQFFEITQHELQNRLQFVQYYSEWTVGLIVDSINFLKNGKINIIDDPTSKMIFTITADDKCSPSVLELEDMRFNKKYSLKRRKNKFGFGKRIVDVHDGHETDAPRSIFRIETDIMYAKTRILNCPDGSKHGQFRRVSAGPEKWMLERDRYWLRSFPKSDALLNAAFVICFDRLFMR